MKQTLFLTPLMFHQSTFWGHVSIVLATILFLRWFGGMIIDASFLRVTGALEQSMKETVQLRKTLSKFKPLLKTFGRYHVGVKNYRHAVGTRIPELVIKLVALYGDFNALYPVVSPLGEFYQSLVNDEDDEDINSTELFRNGLLVEYMKFANKSVVFKETVQLVVQSYPLSENNKIRAKNLKEAHECLQLISVFLNTVKPADLPDLVYEASSNHNNVVMAIYATDWGNGMQPNIKSVEALRNNLIGNTPQADDVDRWLLHKENTLVAEEELLVLFPAQFHQYLKKAS